jgi:hypothetical protein
LRVGLCGVGLMANTATNERRGRRANVLVAVALGLFTFGLLLGTANDYGLTYDEPIYASNTLLVQEWLSESVWRVMHGDLAWPVRRATLDRYWRGKDLKPGTLKLVGAITDTLIGPAIGGLARSRAGAILFPSVLLGCMYAFCAPRWGRAAALFGALSLLFMPHFFAQAHLFAMDVPVAALWTLTLLALVRLSETGRWRWAALAGVVFGLALGTKPNAFFIPIAFFIWALWMRRDILGKAAVALLAIGPVVFLLTWPWLWQAPVSRFMEYVRYYMIYQPIATTYFGVDYRHQYAPWHYPLVMLGITTPPLTLAVCLLGTLIAARRVPRGDKTAALLLISLGVTILFACLPSTPKHHGIRLFIQALPLLSLLGVQGFAAAKESLARWIARLPPISGLSAGWGPGLALAAALLPAVRATLLTHPYQMSYYSSLIGGPRGAARLGMDATFWGETYLSAVALINALPEGATVWVSPPGTQSLLEFYQRGGLIRPDIVLRNDEDLPPADLAVFHNHHAEIGPGALLLLERARPVHVTELEGAPLLFVFDRDAIAAARGDATQDQSEGPGPKAPVGPVQR